jgi:phosphoribosylformimino-5-aminoimidazole carboxamide ribotide isomerase
VEVWPAIDLRGGRCVRLAQGDYDRQTVYDDDPVAVALRFADEGARRLHLVDLDGAKAGRPCHVEVVRRIVREAPLVCEVGGGIRDDASIDMWLGEGVARVVLGTAALKQPEWFRTVCRKHPRRIVLGVDARDGRVATDGWLDTSDVTATELIEQFTQEPLAAIVYTDIATDGMLVGPNVAATAALQRSVAVPVIASGGIRNADDVKQLAEAGLPGCIIGRALYENTITIGEALHAAGDEVTR